MHVVETSCPVGCKGHEMPFAEGMIQRPRYKVGQAFRPHFIINGVLAAQRGIAFEILAHLGSTVMDFVGGTIDVFGSLPDIVVDSRKFGLVHPVGPHDPAAKPLRMVDHDMERCPLDRYARLLEPDTHFTENIVKEALIARVVCQPAHDVAVRMRGDEIDVWRRVHILLGAVTWIDDAGYVMSAPGDVNGDRRDCAHWVDLGSPRVQRGAALAPRPSFQPTTKAFDLQLRFTRASFRPRCCRASPGNTDTPHASHRSDAAPRPARCRAG